MANLDTMKSDLKLALLSLDRVAAGKVLSDASGDWSPSFAAESLVGAVLTEIGDMWEQGKVALSQIYMSGRICEELVDTYLPVSGRSEQEHASIAIAVLDDYHLLGKRIVYSVLRASGFALKDYGRKDTGELAAHAVNDDIDVLLISTLMLPSALRVKDVRAKLTEARSQAKIVVGGAPFRFDKELWKEVGADAFGWNASDAIRIVTELSGDRK